MKKFFLILLSIFLTVSVFALDVNKDELQSAQSDAVQFENYGGTHAVIDSAQAIVGIGTALGREVAADLENPLSVQPYAKYSVYHVVGSDETSGLDADILFLNETAGVDHINNLRRIITGYLMAAYGYSREDSETLSIFITVYNAVYRGNLSNFSEKYKNAVLTYLTEEAVGLSTNWEDWAGKTQIVIPLGAVSSDGISSVETSVISDDKVVEALRAEDDKSVETRENLTDIKEKEASNASENAKAAQKEAAQAKKDGDKEAARESGKTATEQQQIADRKTEEVKNEREQIAKDKAEVKKSEAEKAASAGEKQKYLTSLFVADEKNTLYSLMTVNPQSGEVVKRSNLRQIREKTMFSISNASVQNEDGTSATLKEAFLAVCGVTDGKSAVKLCIIDADSLEIKKQSDETLSENSPLVQNGDSVLVIITDGGKNYLASYDKNLSLKKRSDVAINGASPLNLFDEGILVTGENGNPVLLNKTSLASVWGNGATSANTRTVDAK